MKILARLLFGIVLIAPGTAYGQLAPGPVPSAPAPPQAAPPAAEGAALPQRRPSVPIQINDEEMGQRIEEAMDDPEFERRIERQIERIGDRFDPHEWRGPAMLAMLTPFAFFALVGAIVWWGIRRNRERMQARMAMHTALLAKFNSGAEFTEFISSRGGREYMEQLTMPSQSHSGGQGRSTWIGYVFTAMGAGMILVRLVEGGRLMGGVIFLAIGIGHLLSVRSARQAAERLEPPSGLNSGGTANTGSTQIPTLPNQ